MLWEGVGNKEAPVAGGTEAARGILVHCRLVPLPQAVLVRQKGAGLQHNSQWPRAFSWRLQFPPLWGGASGVIVCCVSHVVAMLPVATTRRILSVRACGLSASAAGLGGSIGRARL